LNNEDCAIRALVVEDELLLRNQLSAYLSERGFVVDVAMDGVEGYHYGKEYAVDIALIDLGLPKLSGVELVRRLRQNGKRFPIIILTARGQWQDKVEGLEAGADDYLVKPFHYEELLARMHALLRRVGGWTQTILQAGPIQLDLTTQKVFLEQVLVELTAYEYKILEYLMLHPGHIISKTVLTEHVYAQEFERDSNVIEVFIARLRRKLDPDNTYSPIETLRGRGYRFTLSPQEIS
jgi:two-component system, OmpR family, response regulator PhoP